MKVYAFVPAKGTSERVENKNSRFLDGDRLYIKALKTLLQCRQVDRVFLDTESEYMYNLADYLPISFMKREPALANNETDGHRLFLNEVNAYPEADIYVQLLCTSPFIKPETIDNAVMKLKENHAYDSAVLMNRDKFYFWKDGKPVYDMQHIPNSKDLPYTEIESMGLYICRKQAALDTRRRYGDNPYFIYGAIEELVDVNTREDLEFAELIAKGKRRKECKELHLMKHFISSPILSDILDDMKIEKNEDCGAIVNNWLVNIKHSKLFGRANTLKLRALKDGEDFRGIYDALDSYAGIGENDIIVVQNELNEYAYFGDLNARLAIRSGVSGVVIDGATRDNVNTALLGLPVFSRAYNAADVRRRATLESINKPVEVGGKRVFPGDLIFMDECSMVIIYQKYEKEVIQRAFSSVNNEKHITFDILSKKCINEIIDERGAF